MSPRHADSHVRARARLLRRVADRWLEWHGSAGTRAKSESWDDYDARMLQAAGVALATYSTAGSNGRSSWHDGWGNKYGKYGKYYTFGPKQEVLGQHKEVPTSVVHAITCRGLTDALKRTMPMPVPTHDREGFAR